ncbi:MAG: hypothetical protein R3B09_25620 [Nannocystaceae bacterium]
MKTASDVQVKRDEFAARAQDALTLLPGDEDIEEWQAIVNAIRERETVRADPLQTGRGHTRKT